jgi:hypothetical protein
MTRPRDALVEGGKMVSLELPVFSDSKYPNSPMPIVLRIEIVMDSREYIFTQFVEVPIPVVRHECNSLTAVISVATGLGGVAK